jgi:hypothetical protein
MGAPGSIFGRSSNHQSDFLRIKQSAKKNFWRATNPYFI